MKFYENGKPGITYDDVLIRPAYSELNSRLDANPYTSLWTEINKEWILAPIFVANMKTIATVEMANALGDLKIVVPMHRFQSIEEEIDKLMQIKYRPKAASVGLHDRERTERVAEHADILFLELAHADHKLAIEEIKWIKSFSNKFVITGNVSTADACKRLFDAGTNMCKIGTGSGGVCSTRQVTGCGVPQLSAVIECAGEGPIIADGGIRHSGDIVKALAARAQFTMIGSLFAGTDEACGDRLDDGTKVYFGMASKEAGKVISGRTAEGISTRVPYMGKAIDIAENLIAGIRQGMAMVGAHNLQELYEKAVFQTISVNTVQENKPHARDRRW